MKSPSSNAFSVIEVVVSLGLLTVVSSGVLLLLLDALRAQSSSFEVVRAQFLAIEGQEAGRAIRDDKYSRLQNGVYGLRRDEGYWELTPDPDVDELFTRSITIAPALRNAQGVLVADGGDVDKKTKKITTAVSWNTSRGAQSVALTQYLSNWRSKNWLQDTVADFSSGTLENTLIANAAGGEVQLVFGSGESVLDDGLAPGWSIDMDAGDVNEESVLAAFSGVTSLLMNLEQGGNLEFQKALNVSGFSQLSFAVNVFSPWAYALYSANPNGNLGNGVTFSNTVYGNAYLRNTESFTDFPALDFAAIKSQAQSTNSYINAGNNDYTLDEVAIAGYQGKLVYVEFSSGNKTLKVQIPSANANYSISIVSSKKLKLEDYNNASLTAVGAFPVIAAGERITLDENAPLTLSGLVYGNEKFDSQALSGANLFTLNGSLVINQADNKIKNVSLRYSQALDTPQPPNYFLQHYFGQIMRLSVSNGGEVALNTYIPAGSIDVSLTTWQSVSVPLADLQMTSPNMNFFRFTDNNGSDPTAVFFDRIEFQSTLPVPDGNYISSVFDTGSAASEWNDISWVVSVSDPATLRFQMRVADTQNGLNNAVWTGPDGSSLSYYSTSGTDIVIHPQAAGTRFAQYKAYFSSGGAQTPVLSLVKVNYNE